MRQLTEEEYHSGSDISFSPPRGSKRGPNVGNLTPVEGDNGHSKPRYSTEELVDDNIVRNNPANPVGVRERLKHVAREPVPRERADEDVSEEAFARNSPTITHTSIALRVKCVEERTRNEVCWPDHGGRLNKESSGDTANGEADLHNSVSLNRRCEGDNRLTN